jgi:type IV secretory pathway VirB2 component (pilin)
LLLCTAIALAQDPGAKVGASIQSMFTGTLVLGLTIAGIVVAGVMWIFGGHGMMQVLSRVIFGAVLIMDAAKIVTWIQSLL